MTMVFIQSQETEIITHMDRELYMAAARGEASVFREYNKKHQLDRLLTKGKNTVLHVHFKNRDEKTKSYHFVEEICRTCPTLMLVQKNTRGDTPLHIAARYGDAPSVELLMKVAKDLEADTRSCLQVIGIGNHMLRTKNRVGDTALHIALRLNDYQVGKILIEEDNKIICYGNEACETPLYLALKGGNRDLVLEMLDKCKSEPPAYGAPNGRTLLHEAVIRNDEEMTKAIQWKWRELCKKADQKGWVPSHYAANLGNPYIVKMLLECDSQAAYVKDNNMYGRIPLQVAAPLGCRSVIKEIISWCPDCCELVNEIAQDSSGAKTPDLPKEILESIDKIPSFGRADVADINQFGRDGMAFMEENQQAFHIWSKTYSEQVHIHYEATNQPISEAQDKEATLVVAALIATVTFAAGFTLPGGYVREKGEQEGNAILKNNSAFKAFLMTDTIAMVLSSCAVFIRLLLTLKRDRTKDSSYFMLAFYLIIVAMVAMVAAFMMGIYAVLA